MSTGSLWYTPCKEFLCQNIYIIGKLEATSASPFTSDLVHKYFTIQRTYNPSKQKNENRITAYDDCPAWVLLEMLTFGDFIKFYEFYYSFRNFTKIPIAIINLVKSLRNGAAHNNCILTDLEHGTSGAPHKISQEVAKIAAINSNQRRKSYFSVLWIVNGKMCLNFLREYIDKSKKYAYNEIRIIKTYKFL